MVARDHETINGITHLDGQGKVPRLLTMYGRIYGYVGCLGHKAAGGMVPRTRYRQNWSFR